MASPFIVGPGLHVSPPHGYSSSTTSLHSAHFSFQEMPISRNLCPNLDALCLAIAALPPQAASLPRSMWRSCKTSLKWRWVHSIILLAFIIASLHDNTLSALFMVMQVDSLCPWMIVCSMNASYINFLPYPIAISPMLTWPQRFVIMILAL